MSGETAEQRDAAAESELEEGFARSLRSDDGGTDAAEDNGADGATAAAVEGGAGNPADGADGGTTEEPSDGAEDAPATTPPPEMPEYRVPPEAEQPPAARTGVPAVQESAPMLEAVPEDIEEEWKRLKAVSPEAARLALEDSPEGERLRSRLESYGAELALDRAERVLELRDRARQEAERSRRAVEEHNRQFFATLGSRVPEYTAMLRDSGRAGELRAYQRDVVRWIESKPYAEGARLMRIAQSGKDAGEVADLLERFERERAGARRTPDPTGALAVPGRRGPSVAPAGVGDKDDFDAGFRLSLNEKR